MLFQTSNIMKIDGPLTFLLYENAIFFLIDVDLVYNLKTILENMTQPFLKILKSTFIETPCMYLFEYFDSHSFL